MRFCPSVVCGSNFALKHSQKFVWKHVTHRFAINSKFHYYESKFHLFNVPCKLFSSSFAYGREVDSNKLGDDTVFQTPKGTNKQDLATDSVETSKSFSYELTFA